MYTTFLKKTKADLIFLFKLALQVSVCVVGLWEGKEGGRVTCALRTPRGSLTCRGAACLPHLASRGGRLAQASCLTQAPQAKRDHHCPHFRQNSCTSGFNISRLCSCRARFTDHHPQGPTHPVSV